MGLTVTPYIAYALPQRKGYVSMALKYHLRSRPEGRAHRTKIRVLLLPKLKLGQALPTGSLLGRWLRIHPSEAYRHLRRTLAEDGYRTETRGKGKACRVYVVALPERRAAA